MKIKDNFVLQNVADEYLVVPIAEEADRLHGVIKLSKTGAFLWEILLKGINSISELDTALAQEYGIDQSLAHKDVEVYLSQLEAIGCLE
jgi:hypothetical protein